MEFALKAHFAGIVTVVGARPGAQVALGATLFVVESACSCPFSHAGTGQSLTLSANATPEKAQGLPGRPDIRARR